MGQLILQDVLFVVFSEIRVCAYTIHDNQLRNKTNMAICRLFRSQSIIVPHGSHFMFIIFLQSEHDVQMYATLSNLSVRERKLFTPGKVSRNQW